MRDWHGSEEWRVEQAVRAAKDPSMRDTVMSMKELDELWRTSAAGTVKIFMLQARGWADDSSTHSRIKSLLTSLSLISSNSRGGRLIAAAGGAGTSRADGARADRRDLQMCFQTNCQRAFRLCATWAPSASI